MTLAKDHIEPRTPDPGDFAVVLTGGGARAAYQVGFLRSFARQLPEERIPIITGVSAGAINAAYLASHPGSTAEAVDELSALWRGLTVDRVFRSDTLALLKNAIAWLLRLGGGGISWGGRVRSLVDSEPLRQLLHRELGDGSGEIPGIAANVAADRLKALALTALDYTTGRTVTWTQGREIRMWERPHRRSEQTRIGVAHVLASAALPLLFPAVRVGTGWFGDGGVRLTAPLSPALHLGATRILAISTRYDRSQAEAARPVVRAYPPPAQILGQLLNAIFLDMLDQDVQRAERLNQLLALLPADRSSRLKQVEVLVLRPSRDLGRLAAQHEAELPGAFRFLTRGLGTRETESPDLLSLLLFQPDYVSELIEVGERDADAHSSQIIALARGEPVPTPSS